ncbi:MAG: hypothetical protein DCC65_10655 [Planctomycetota bacterium]|nr:MAG: hypothetical protein DCC65_10655 [Planctomycetota bacterium]
MIINCTANRLIHAALFAALVITHVCWPHTARADTRLFQLDCDTCVSYGHDSVGLRDLNSDNIIEFAISDPDYDDGTGAVFIYSGATGTLLYTIAGEDEEDRFGSSLAFTDLNNDGARDLLVGATGYTTPNCQGGSLPPGHQYVGYAKGFTLSQSAATQLFKITGSANDLFGISVAGLGDINSDDVTDFVIGKANNSNGVCDAQNALQGVLAFYAGASSGSTRSLIRNTYIGVGHGLVGLATGGDVDGDGIDDALGRAASRVVVFSGDNGDVIGLVTRQSQDFDLFGAQIISDMNSDGFDDVGVCESVSSSQQSVQDAATNTLSLFSGDDDGNGSITLHASIVRKGYGFCRSIANLGDYNADGVHDVLVGSPSNHTVTGRYEIYSDSLDKLTSGVIAGESAMGHLAFGLNADINSDGRNDIVLAGKPGTIRKRVFVLSPGVAKTPGYRVSDGLVSPF